MKVKDSDFLPQHRALIDACLRHRVSFFWHDPGTFLISAKGIRAVLADVQAAGERILGFEGFELESEVIHPRIDLIYDATTFPRGGPLAVLEEWGTDVEHVWIDVTLAKKKARTEPGPLGDPASGSGK